MSRSFSETQSIPEDFKEVNAQIALEARREFLQQFVEKEFKLTDPRLKKRDAILQSHIDQLTAEIKKQPSVAYTAPILLTKLGQDHDGISTRLATQFGQLFNGSLPYVQLSAAGIKFFWTKESEAAQFAEMLQAHGFEIQTAADQSVQSQDEEKTELCEKYSHCSTVQLSHLQASKLLSLAQYHPYNLKATLDDWYKSKKLNRALLLIQESVLAKKTDSLPVHYTDLQRVQLDDKNDLVNITIETDVKEHSSIPHHVVILLDDSSSMDGDKIKAANAALKKFVLSLPKDTLVSIQPMNAKTIAYRVRAGDIQQTRESERDRRYFSTPADGGTPLKDILAASAVFLRKDPQGLIIPEAALNNTTIALLTDGQGDTASAAIHAMQTSQGIGDEGFKKALSIKGISKWCSYGVPGLACKSFPAILPIGIGPDADVNFIDELVAHLHTLFKHVKIDDGMQADIEEALATLNSMQKRIPSSFIGLTYQMGEDTKNVGATGTEEHNLFNHCKRNIYFKIPREAKHLTLGFLVDRNANVEHIELKRSHKPAIVEAFYEQEFAEIQIRFSNQFHALKDRTGSSRGSSRWGGSAPTSTSSVSVAQKWELLKDTTLAEVDALLAITKSDTLRSDILLFKTQLGKFNINDTSPMNSLVDRATIARYTQIRMLGAKKEQSVTSATEQNPLLHAIETDAVSDPDALLEKHKQLINVKQENKYAAPPLVRAVIRLNQLQETKANPDTIKQMQEFIIELIKRPEVDLLEVDAGGNSALHRAVFYKQKNIVGALLEKAKANKQLSQLLHLRNNNKIGGTAGETALWFIQKTMPDLLKLIQVPVDEKESEMFASVDKAHFEAVLSLLKQKPELSNQHLKESTFYRNGTTPLMVIIKLLSNKIGTYFTPEQKEQALQTLITLIKSGKVDLLESDDNGNTLLHQAFYHDQYGLGQVIIEMAYKQEILIDVLAARNTVGLVGHGGGEVPHMNFAMKGGQALLAFQPALDRAILLIIKYAQNYPQIEQWLAEQKDIFLPTLLSGMLELLDVENRRLLVGEKDLKTDAPFSADIIQQDVIDLQAAKSATLSLAQWLECQQALSPHLSPAQAVELNLIGTLYRKHLERYNSASFLKGSPLQLLNKLIEHCKFVLSKNKNLKPVDSLLAYLEEIKLCNSQEEFDLYDQKIVSALAQVQELEKDPCYFEIQALYSNARHVLAQYKAYQTAEITPIPEFTTALLTRQLSKSIKKEDKKATTGGIMDYAIRLKNNDEVQELRKQMLAKDFEPLRTASSYTTYRIMDGEDKAVPSTQSFSDLEYFFALLVIRNTVEIAETARLDLIESVSSLKADEAFKFINNSRNIFYGDKVKTLFSDSKNIDKDKKLLAEELTALQKRYHTI